MKPSEALVKNRQAIRDATRGFNAAIPRVFGSSARSKDRADSGLDILVDALPGSTLLSFGGLQDTLEQIMLGTSVHLLTLRDFPEKVLVSVWRKQSRYE